MRSYAALLVVLLVVGAAAGTGSADAIGLSQSPTERQSAAFQQTASASSVNETMPETTIRIDLLASGDARWNISMRFNLQSENETQAFKQLGAEENALLSQTFFERLASQLSDQTGREMDITDVSRSEPRVSDRQNRSVGVVSVRFTWTNFTRKVGNDIVLGDVFLTESGTWLSTLVDGQRLVIDSPNGYYPSSSSGGLENGSLQYDGPRQFEPGDISATYKLKSPPTPTPAGEDFDFTDMSSLVVLLAVIGAGGAMAYVWTRRREEPAVSSESEPEDGKTDHEIPEDKDGGGDEPPQPRAESEPPDDDETETDVELLSDEERVLRLLRQNNGRMKQANIVKETNWSNAKVSQLLSAMDEEDRINKLRIGRENLITLPDEDVTDLT